MFEVKVTVDTRKVERALKKLAEKQLPGAIAEALTTTAMRASDDVKTEMKKIFDRPTPYTVNSVYARPAKPETLEAAVMVREWGGKGRSARKYLTPEVTGGPRVLKAFERALAPVSGGRYVVPARGAQMDAYGNISRGQIVQIISRLGLFGESGYRANMTDRSRARLIRQGKMTPARGQRADYFVAKSKVDGEPLGIYRLVGKGQVEPVLIFQNKAPTYHPIFPFDQIVVVSVRRNFDKKFAKAIRKAAKGFTWR